MSRCGAAARAVITGRRTWDGPNGGSTDALQQHNLSEGAVTGQPRAHCVGRGFAAWPAAACRLDAVGDITSQAKPDDSTYPGTELLFTNR